MKQLFSSLKRGFKLIYILFFVSLSLLCSCNKSNEPIIENRPTTGDEPTIEKACRTILVYMLADNNLGENYHFDTQNINDMLEAAADNGLNDGNLIIYRDGYDHVPQLIKITSPQKGSANQVVIKEYPDRNSANPEVLREVIDETITQFPADEYGLILWSHSTGWVPNNLSIALAPPHIKGLPPTRSFGLDNRDYLELDEMANAIPDRRFHFILNDACFTAGVEYVYQLRNKTRYHIGSSAEVMGAGMPYKKIIPLLFDTTRELSEVCETIYNHYNDQSGPYRTATVSLIDCAQLEGLAYTVAGILANHPEEFIPSSTGSIQRFDRQSPLICFDLKDYLSTFMNESESTLLNEALHQAVPYQAATPKILDLFSVNTHCGLTTYILGTGKNEKAESYYKTLDWYNRVYPQ